MSLSQRLLVAAAPSAIIAAMIASVLHAPTTVLVVADTDAVSFSPQSDVTFAIEGTVTTSCPPSGPAMPISVFKGRIETQLARVSIARVAAHSLNVVVAPRSGYSVDLIADNSTYKFPCFVSVLIPTDFFTKSDALFSVAGNVNQLTIGGTGRTDGDTRGVTLVSGTAQTLTKTLLGDRLIRGAPVPLALGDVVNFQRDLNGGHSPAVVFVRVQAEGTVAVTAHLPVEALALASIGSSGTLVWVSWWDRIVAEPTLLLASTLLGILLAMPGIWQSSLAVLAMTRLRNPRTRRGNQSTGAKK